MQLSNGDENIVSQSVTSKHGISKESQRLQYDENDESGEIRADRCTNSISVTSLSPAYIDP